MISTRRAIRSYVLIPRNFFGASRSRIAMRSSRGGSHPGRDLSDCALATEQVRSVAMNPSILRGDMNIANSLYRKRLLQGAIIAASLHHRNRQVVFQVWNHLVTGCAQLPQVLGWH